MQGALLLALVAASGLFVVNITPALVTGLQLGWGFTAKAAGLVAAANGYGTVAGGLFAALGARLLTPARRWIAIALAMMIACDIASSFTDAVGPLATLRFTQGVLGGLVTGLAFAAIGRSAAPQRVFGTLLFIQFGAGGVGVATLPLAVQHWGAGVIFAVLALLEALVLLLVVRSVFPDGPVQAAGSPVDLALPSRAAALPALAAVFLFQCGHMVAAASILDIGRAAGLDTARVSAVAGIAGAMGIIGALAAIAIGQRLGRSLPLLTAMLLAVAGAALLLLAGQPSFFIAAAMLSSVCWTFALSYLLGRSAAVSGAWSSLASKLGLASGPLLGALLVHDRDFRGVIAAAIILTALATAVAVAAIATTKPTA